MKKSAEFALLIAGIKGGDYSQQNWQKFLTAVLGNPKPAQTIETLFDALPECDELQTASVLDALLRLNPALLRSVLDGNIDVKGNLGKGVIIRHAQSQWEEGAIVSRDAESWLVNVLRLGADGDVIAQSIDFLCEMRSSVAIPYLLAICSSDLSVDYQGERNADRAKRALEVIRQDVGLQFL